MRRGVRLAVTLGDPRGIGPEVAAGALGAAGGASSVRVIGPEDFAGSFEAASNGVPGQTPAVQGATDAAGPTCRYEVVDAGPASHPGRAAGRAIERAVELALAREVDAVVTAPVHKPALRDAGYPPGHTEMLMELSGAPEVGMLMCDEGAGGEDAPPSSPSARATADGPRPPGRAPRPDGHPRRVLLATIHIPLAEVPSALTTERLVSQTRLLARALRSDWAIPMPRIALCALNPHASDDGMFGTEERDVYEPALAALAGAPCTVSGPFPADTVFVRAFGGEFDAVVSPYHDVGMAAFKTAAFGRGVNATLGLPFIRTSPDHGTAFDIAGRGKADPSSMAQAVRLAVRLARARADAGHAS